MSLLSATLLSVTMPAYMNAPVFLGWFALVPLLLALELYPDLKIDSLTLPFGVLSSVAVHYWYASVFSPVVGMLLMIGAGFGMLLLSV